MKPEMQDRDGKAITLGTPVRYEFYNRGEHVERIGLVREMIFRPGSSAIKVSGGMNRALSPDDVSVVEMTPQEALLLGAFADKRAIVDLDEVRRLAREMEAAG